MDFDERLDATLEAFRTDVRNWLAASFPKTTQLLGAALPVTEGTEQRRDLQSQLADKGWSAPSWPAEYGGGGLTPDYDLVVQRELEAHNLPTMHGANRSSGSAILAWGTLPQKQSFIPALLQGAIVVSKPFYEAYSVAYPDGVRTKAVRDGDVYILTGEEVFVGYRGSSTHFWTIAVTDDKAPPHKRLSVFLISRELQGVETARLETIASEPRIVVTMDQAQVPAEYRIGDEGDGALVAHHALGAEAEAEQTMKEHDTMVAALIKYCGEKHVRKLPKEQYQRIQQMVAEAHINGQILRLISTRNQWMRSNDQEMTFQPSQFAMLARAMRPRLSDIMLENMGPLALVNDERWSISDGAAEAFQRSSLPGVTAGDSVGIYENLIAHHLRLPAVDPAGRSSSSPDL
ncbi:MAG: hypothetical protein EXR50_02345 [Dehalococcoidia bacterium]|nr:hypothetical protein [Dehalococcoidia bacterium]